MIFLVILLILIILCTAIYLHYFPSIPKQKQKYDFALLLGCPAKDNGAIRTSQYKRCHLAIEDYKKGKYQTLLITGGAVKNKYVESITMRDYILKQIEIPIICETKATNTFENFLFSKKIIQNGSVLILTSGTHARRAGAIAKEYFSDYSVDYYPEHRLKHIVREIISRYIHILTQIKKKWS